MDDSQGRVTRDGIRIYQDAEFCRDAGGRARGRRNSG